MSVLCCVYATLFGCSACGTHIRMLCARCLPETRYYANGACADRQRGLRSENETMHPHTQERESEREIEQRGRKRQETDKSSALGCTQNLPFSGVSATHGSRS